MTEAVAGRKESHVSTLSVAMPVHVPTSLNVFLVGVNVGKKVGTGGSVPQ
jgi:hypothetical protein